jgi:hypothetical protein
VLAGADVDCERTALEARRLAEREEESAGDEVEREDERPELLPLAAALAPALQAARPPAPAEI